jgi:hypothetical protein
MGLPTGLSHWIFGSDDSDDEQTTVTVERELTSERTVTFAHERYFFQSGQSTDVVHCPKKSYRGGNETALRKVNGVEHTRIFINLRGNPDWDIRYDTEDVLYVNPNNVTHVDPIAEWTETYDVEDTYTTDVEPPDIEVGDVYGCCEVTDVYDGSGIVIIFRENGDQYTFGK